jgi:hypothetical protein
MSNQEELVVFMTLPLGVEESIIPGVLASRAFQSTCRSDILRVKDDMSRFKFPLRASKMLGERSMTQNGLENSWKREIKIDAVLCATTDANELLLQPTKS